jgi:hypothetical protein
MVKSKLAGMVISASLLFGYEPIVAAAPTFASPIAVEISNADGLVAQASIGRPLTNRELRRQHRAEYRRLRREHLAERHELRRSQRFERRFGRAAPRQRSIRQGVY